MDEPTTHLIQCLHLNLGKNEDVQSLVTVDVPCTVACSGLCGKLVEKGS